MSLKIYTVGHSNKSMEHFLNLIRAYRIDVVADVRSYPFPKYAKHFDTDCLRKSLLDAGFQYVFMGRELGGMPKSQEFYGSDGSVSYEKLAASSAFKSGIERLMNGLTKYTIALMCGEEDPTGCHRRNLLGNTLEQRKVIVSHIRGDGRAQTESELAFAQAPVIDSVQLNLFR